MDDIAINLFFVSLAIIEVLILEIFALRKERKDLKNTVEHFKISDEELRKIIEG